MTNYYDKYGFRFSDSSADIVLELEELISETKNRLRANPTDESLSNRLDELETVLSIFETPEKRQAYDEKIQTPVKTAEDIRLETFYKDFRRAERYLFKENDLDLARAAINKADNSYNEETDHIADFHYLKAAYYFRMQEFEKATEAISDAIVIEDEKVKYHILRLEIYEVTFGKYAESTRKVAKNIIRLLDTVYIENNEHLKNAKPVDQMASWLYFEQDKGPLEKLVETKNKVFKQKGRHYAKLLKNIPGNQSNRVAEYEAYLEAERQRKIKEKAEEAKRVRENERRRLEKMKEDEQKQERLRKQREEQAARAKAAVERRRKKKEKEELALAKRREETRLFNEGIEKEKKIALDELETSYEQKEKSTLTTINIIQWLAPILLVLPGLFVASPYWPLFTVYEQPYLAPVFGLGLSVLLLASISGVVYFHQRKGKWGLSILIFFALAGVFFVVAGQALVQLLIYYLYGLPLWVILFFVYRRANKKNSSLYSTYAADQLAIEQEYNAKKRPWLEEDFNGY